MVNKIESYKKKSIITIHGRNFKKFPIDSYYNSKDTELLHFLYENKEDKLVQFGGTGVMGFHTDLFKLDLNYLIMDLNYILNHEFLFFIFLTFGLE